MTKLTVCSSSSLLQPKALGQTLLSEVFLRGNLMESDYFGLEFQNMQMNWVSGSGWWGSFRVFCRATRWTQQQQQQCFKYPTSDQDPEHLSALLLQRLTGWTGPFTGPLSLAQCRRRVYSMALPVSDPFSHTSFFLLHFSKARLQTDGKYDR